MRKLEEKYPTEMAVIGVHSAKFLAEQATDNVRQAILRYRVKHPVVNDKDFTVWQQYACRAWPTLMFIDPQGKVIGKHEGELSPDAFDKLLGDMVKEFDNQGLLDRRPLDYRLEEAPKTPLSFPGKVLADSASGRLFIADSNHHRILVVSLDGTVERIVGNGDAGLVDGSLDMAQFNNPQGLALDGDLLYVADSENHAIRRVDLGSGMVDTIAGTGEQATAFQQGGIATETPLSSPWDVTLHQGVLYIAMAGLHQLWALDLESGQERSYAGSGRENIVDGPLPSACLAQPSGIDCDGLLLYFADSEVSGIRTADLDAAGQVRTIVGQGLFEFGDVDGQGDVVRLQHPLGLCVADGVIYVTDTYNNKIKVVNSQTRSSATLLGTGEAGLRDGPGSQAIFHEPGGLAIAGGKLYIADTNNHAVRVADLSTREVTTLELQGL